MLAADLSAAALFPGLRSVGVVALENEAGDGGLAVGAHFAPHLLRRAVAR